MPRSVRVAVVTELSEVRVQAAARVNEKVSTMFERVRVFVAVAPVSRRASTRAVGVSRPLHRRESSVLMDEQTANTSVQRCSSRGQQLGKVSRHGSMQSEIDLLTLITTGILRDPVCHSGDWEGVRPWPCPLLAGRDPGGEDDRTPDEEARKEKNTNAVEFVS